MTNTINYPNRRGFNRWNPAIERDEFAAVPDSGWQCYSGNNVSVFFDDILVEEMDSIGFQLSQNVRPVYGYHSHVWNAIQYGSKLVQGYFQIHFTESAYVPTLLTMLEAQRRGGWARDPYGRKDVKRQRRGYDTWRNRIDPAQAPEYESTPTLGTTLEEATEAFRTFDNWRGTEFGDFEFASDRDAYPYWQILADEYDASRWGTQVHGSMFEESLDPRLKIRGLFPAQPGLNEFSYNPRGSLLRATGFTINLMFGDAEGLQQAGYVGGDTFHRTTRDAPSIIWPDMYYGTVRQLHEVHIIAGPNVQIDTDGKPLSELYTFIAKDIS